MMNASSRVTNSFVTSVGTRSASITPPLTHPQLSYQPYVVVQEDIASSIAGAWSDGERWLERSLADNNGEFGARERCWK